MTPSGRPAPRLVWFLWTDGGALIYSQPGAAKLRHITANDRVTLNFNFDALGGDAVVLAGPAELAPDAPSADTLPELQDKYAGLLEAIGMTAEHFTSTYTMAIRVIPDHAWTVPALSRRVGPRQCAGTGRITAETADIRTSLLRDHAEAPPAPLATSQGIGVNSTAVRLARTGPRVTEGPAARAALARRTQHPVPGWLQLCAVVEARLGQECKRSRAHSEEGTGAAAHLVG